MGQCLQLTASSLNSGSYLNESLQILRARRLKLCTVDSAITLRKAYERAVTNLHCELVATSLGDHWLRHCAATRRRSYPEHEAVLNELMDRAEGTGGGLRCGLACCLCPLACPNSCVSSLCTLDVAFV